MEEIINLRHEGMSVQELSLKLTKLSKYATSLVFNPRDDISLLLTGVFEHLFEECRSAMLYENIDISQFMIMHDNLKRLDSI